PKPRSSHDVFASKRAAGARKCAPTVTIGRWRPASSLRIASPGHAQQRVAVYVGPQVRDGFVDVDSGIVDSIKDIRDELAQSQQVSVATSPEQDAILLIVLGRGIVTNGSIGFGNAFGGTGTMMVMPHSTPTLTTILRVGDYQKQFQSEGGTWRYAARQVMK